MPITKEQAEQFVKYINEPGRVQPDFVADSETIRQAFGAPDSATSSILVTGFDLGREYAAWEAKQPVAAATPSPLQTLADIEKRALNDLTTGVKPTPQQCSNLGQELADALREAGNVEGAADIETFNNTMSALYGVTPTKAA